MIAGASPRSRPSLVLLLLCLALAGSVAAQVLLPPDGPPAGSSAGVAANTPVAVNLRPGFSMRPLDAFSEVIERPLFRPDRRPAPAAVASTATGGKSRHVYTLLGVVIDDGLRMALLRAKGAKQTLRVREGNEIDGWTIEDVRPDRVVLRRGGVSEEVRLRDLPSTKRKMPTPAPEKTAAKAPKTDKKADDAKLPAKPPEQGK